MENIEPSDNETQTHLILGQQGGVARAGTSSEEETDQITDQALASPTLDNPPLLDLTPADRSGPEWIPVNCLHYTQVLVHGNDQTSQSKLTFNGHLTFPCFPS